MARNVNFSLFAGEDKSLVITIYQADGVTKQDVTGWTFKFAVYSVDAASTTPTFSKTNGAGITITDAVNGLIAVAIASVDTETLAEGTWRYSLKRSNSGQDTELLYGDLSLDVVTTSQL